MSLATSTDLSRDVDSKDYIDLALSWDVTEHSRLRLGINNLFDEEFFTNSFADVWVQPGAERNFRVTASYRF